MLGGTDPGVGALAVLLAVRPFALVPRRVAPALHAPSVLITIFPHSLCGADRLERVRVVGRVASLGLRDCGEEETTKR